MRAPLYAIDGGLLHREEARQRVRCALLRLALVLRAEAEHFPGWELAIAAGIRFLLFLEWLASAMR
jgi:hypothetical protein